MPRKQRAPSPSRQLFAEQLRLERHAQSLKLEELEDKADLTWSYIASVERGERNISIDNMDALASALDIHLYALLMKRHDRDSLIEVDKNYAFGEKNIIGVKLRSLRKGHDPSFSSREFVALLKKNHNIHISTLMLSRIERGQRIVYDFELKAFAHTLEIDVSQLFSNS